MSHNGNKKQAANDRRLLKPFRRLTPPQQLATLHQLLHPPPLGPLGPPSPSSARTFYIIPPTGGKFRL